jgi:hypothetical protein
VVEAACEVLGDARTDHVEAVGIGAIADQIGRAGVDYPQVFSALGRRPGTVFSARQRGLRC